MISVFTCFTCFHLKRKQLYPCVPKELDNVENEGDSESHVVVAPFCVIVRRSSMPRKGSVMETLAGCFSVLRGRRPSVERWSSRYSSSWWSSGWPPVSENGKPSKQVVHSAVGE